MVHAPKWLQQLHKDCQNFWQFDDFLPCSAVGTDLWQFFSNDDMTHEFLKGDVSVIRRQFFIDLDVARKHLEANSARQTNGHHSCPLCFAFFETANGF